MALTLDAWLTDWDSKLKEINETSIGEIDAESALENLEKIFEQEVSLPSLSGNNIEDT